MRCGSDRNEILGCRFLNAGHFLAIRSGAVDVPVNCFAGVVGLYLPAHVPDRT